VGGVYNELRSGESFVQALARILGFAKWRALALTLVVLATWLFSYRWFAVYFGDRFTVSINGYSFSAVYRGRFCVEHRTWLVPGDSFLSRELLLIKPGRPYRQITIPLDATAITVVDVTTVLCVTEFLVKRRSRVRPGYCPHCGYNLNKNVSGRCPECGTPVSRNPQTTARDE